MKSQYLLRAVALAFVSALSLANMVSAQTSATINLADPPTSLNTSPMPVSVVNAYPNLRVSRPIVLTGAGDGSGRLFIASQTGEIYFIKESDSEVEKATLFMSLQEAVDYKDRENEEGLLGLAFHPQFSENGKFYVYYSTIERPHVSIVRQFTTKAGNPNEGDPTSQVELMEIQQPFWNHNGGTLAFGPDGYLYIALGDGGKGNDPLQSGQDTSKLLGSSGMAGMLNTIWLILTAMIFGGVMESSGLLHWSGLMVTVPWALVALVTVSGSPSGSLSLPSTLIAASGVSSSVVSGPSFTASGSRFATALTVMVAVAELASPSASVIV